MCLFVSVRKIGVGFPVFAAHLWLVREFVLLADWLAAVCLVTTCLRISQRRPLCALKYTGL